MTQETSALNAKPCVPGVWQASLPQGDPLFTAIWVFRKFGSECIGKTCKTNVLAWDNGSFLFLPPPPLQTSGKLGFFLETYSTFMERKQMKFLKRAKNATLASHAGFPAWDYKGDCGSVHFILLSQQPLVSGL